MANRPLAEQVAEARELGDRMQTRYSKDRPVVFWGPRAKEAVVESDLLQNFDLVKEYLYIVGGSTPLPNVDTAHVDAEPDNMEKDLEEVSTVEKNFLKSPRHDPPVETVKRVLDYNQDIHDAMQVAGTSKSLASKLGLDCADPAAKEDKGADSAEAGVIWLENMSFVILDFMMTKSEKNQKVADKVERKKEREQKTESKKTQKGNGKGRGRGRPKKTDVEKVSAKKAAAAKSKNPQRKPKEVSGRKRQAALADSDSACTPMKKPATRQRMWKPSPMAVKASPGKNDERSLKAQAALEELLPAMAAALDVQFQSPPEGFNKKNLVLIVECVTYASTCM
eukprot:s683_g22.t1